MASTTAPTSAQRSGLLSRTQPHTRYPPPISQRPASTNKTPTKSNLDILELLSAILRAARLECHTPEDQGGPSVLRLLRSRLFGSVGVLARSKQTGSLRMRGISSAKGWASGFGYRRAAAAPVPQRFSASRKSQSSILRH